MSATGRGSPGRPRSADADRAILAAAQRQLVDDGYGRMSVESVAAEAGVGKTTVYRRYEGKAELAVAAVAALKGDEELPDLGDARAELIEHLRRFERVMRGDVGMSFVGTMLAEERHHPELLSLFRERIVAPGRARLRDVLHRGMARGELREDLDVELTADMLIGSYHARYLSGAVMPRRRPERVVDELLRGLRA